MPPPVSFDAPAVVLAASFTGRGLFPMPDSRSLQASAPFPSIPCADTQASLSRAHARDDERDARKPQRLHGVAEKQGSGQKGPGRAYGPVQTA